MYGGFKDGCNSDIFLIKISSLGVIEFSALFGNYTGAMQPKLAINEIDTNVYITAQTIASVSPLVGSIATYYSDQPSFFQVLLRINIKNLVAERLVLDGGILWLAIFNFLFITALKTYPFLIHFPSFSLSGLK